MLSFALLLGCTKPPKPLPAKEGIPAKPLELPDLSGKTVRLSDYRGKVVLLDFWASWCIPCVEEIPDLIEVHNAYSSQRFTVVGIAIEEFSRTEVEEFVKKHKVPYPILYAEERPAGYKVWAIPTAFLIDRKGLLRQRYLGPKDPLMLRRDIQRLLRESS